MKNTRIILLTIFFASLLVAGCLRNSGDAMEKKASPTPTEIAFASPTPLLATQTPTSPSLRPTQAASPPPSPTQAYSGKVLAGSKALLLDFNKQDFEKARAGGKLVVLYFYASWCPICVREFPLMQSAFDGLQSDKVVGFRVNYKDDATDADEEALAREFGVPYQHTKVFLKNGEKILKSPEGWDEQRYLDEINKALAQQ